MFLQTPEEVESEYNNFMERAGDRYTSQRRTPSNWAK